MRQNKKQHYIPKTYLKHFAVREDGKSLCLIDIENPYKRHIQVKDSGDSIFTLNNFYTSDKYYDPIGLELFFAREIEPMYPSLITELKKENEISDWSYKFKLLQWIIYSKLRSPIWRQYFTDLLNNIERDEIDIPLDMSDAKDLIEYVAVNKNQLTKELHLNFFTSDETLKEQFESFTSVLTSKRWTIIRRPENSYWWTTDNPGFGIQLDNVPEDGVIIPSPFWEIRNNYTVLYYPLTKDYCLQIHPYNMGDDLHLNLRNTPIDFRIATESETRWINFWTVCTNKRMVIAPTKRSLEEVESILQANSL